MRYSNKSKCLPIDRRDWEFFDVETCAPSEHDRCSGSFRWSCKQSEPKPFRGHLTQLRIGTLYLTIEHSNQPLRYQGSEQAPSLMFHIAHSIESKLHYRGQSVEPDALIVLPGKVVEYGNISGPMDGFIVASIDQRTFEGVLEGAAGDRRPAEYLRWGRVNSDRRTVEEFSGTFNDILRHLVARPDAIDDRAYRQSVIDRIVPQLVGAFCAAGPQVCELPRPSTRAYIVERAIEYIHANLAEEVSIADLCRITRVSRRTLSYSFGEVVGVSPARYLLTTRLSRVRQELVRLGDRRFIYCVAQSSGFSHMGRFANFYQQAFGELPSETCTNSRIRTSERPDEPWFRSSASAQ